MYFTVIVWVIKSRRMRWVGHVVCVVEKVHINVYVWGSVGKI